MLFTSKGKMYRLLVDNVPAGTNASKGVNISSLLNIEPDEKVIAMTSLNRKTDAEYVVFVTKQGLIKKTALEEYKSVKRNTGIAAIKLKEGDSIANVTFLKDEEIIVITKEGMSIHFTTADINPIGRATSGVKSIKLDDGDEVLIGLPIHKKTDNVAIITTKGLGKKVALEEFPLQGRGGKGVYAHKPSEMTGKIAGAAMVDNEDNILVVGKPNSICISAEDMPTTGRAAAGNIIIKNEVKHIVKI